jgi:cold shock CspA family protein
MQSSPVIVFRRIRGTEALEADIRARLAGLEKYSPELIGARVLVELDERHHRDGNRYHVRIDLSVPGEDVIVTHDASLRPALRARAAPRTRKVDELDPGHRRAKVAIREAFEAARRRLQDSVRRRRGAVKAHEPAPTGVVIRLFPDEDYGFIQAADGHEVYFQNASVLGGAFGRLTVGSKVVFAEQRGEKGPQASTVRLVKGVR